MRSEGMRAEGVSCGCTSFGLLRRAWWVKRGLCVVLVWVVFNVGVFVHVWFGSDESQFYHRHLYKEVMSGRGNAKLLPTAIAWLGLDKCVLCGVYPAR